MTQNDRLMHSLKSKLNILLDRVPRGSKIAYIDQPLHLNVGDLLINQGLESFLAAHEIEVDIRLSLRDFDTFKSRITDEHVIILHGGGNFGDIWPKHEALRQKVLTTFVRNRILLFPQTIFFQNESRTAELSKAYRDHPDFTMYVRDPQSVEFAAAKLGLECHLCPDTAHYLWESPLLPIIPSKYEELKFLRRDKEAASKAEPNTKDWANLVTPTDAAVCLLTRNAMGANPVFTLQPPLMKTWYTRRDKIIANASRYFSQYEKIRTSRLHGAILGLLLSKEVSVIDNSYGKLSRYLEHWAPGAIKYVTKHS